MYSVGTRGLGQLTLICHWSASVVIVGPTGVIAHEAVLLALPGTTR